MGEKKIMLGNAAIARGAYEAGVKVSAAYPGTPSTEISENIVKYPMRYMQNGHQMKRLQQRLRSVHHLPGVRSIVSMKHVGVNVASDPLFTAAYTGVKGGMVLVAADDPGMYSSQNEQDSRLVARTAMIPVLNHLTVRKQRSSQSMHLNAARSTILRSCSVQQHRLAHSQGVVELNDRVEVDDKPYERDIKKMVMMPGNAIPRHVFVEQRLKDMAADGADMPINRVEMNDTRVGVITSGIPYQYVKEAMPNASVLKLGMVNPLPKKVDRRTLCTGRQGVCHRGA